MLDTECDLINGKQHYTQAKSTEKYAPALSATDLPSAFTATITESLIFKAECLPCFMMS